MYIDFLLEEPSMEVLLNNILPRLMGESHTFGLHPFGGKPDMLANLQKRLAGYGKAFPGIRVVVLIDQHEQDCRILKHLLEEKARSACVTTRSTQGKAGGFVVLNRIVVKQLESWLLGDPQALMEAYPRVRSDPTRKKGLRNPDDMRGDPAIMLFGILQKAGYFRGRDRLPKKEVAAKISLHMKPERNRSVSFQVFAKGIMEMIR